MSSISIAAITLAIISGLSTGILIGLLILKVIKAKQGVSTKDILILKRDSQGQFINNKNKAVPLKKLINFHNSGKILMMDNRVLSIRLDPTTNQQKVVFAKSESVLKLKDKLTQAQNQLNQFGQKPTSTFIDPNSVKQPFVSNQSQDFQTPAQTDASVSTSVASEQNQQYYTTLKFNQ